MKKLIMAGLLALSLIGLNVPDAQAASVQQWKKVDSNWYYYNSSGTTYKGWLLDNDNWYYLNLEGKMETGWALIKGNWYYFNASGEMQTGWVRASGKWYFLEDNGKMKKGWHQENGNWYHLNEKTGEMETDWKLKVMSNKWYYFNESGIMQTGWLKYNSRWFLLDQKGVMKTGWVQQGNDYNKWYYFKDAGYPIYGDIEADHGAMQTGWFYQTSGPHLGRGYYYAKPDGLVVFDMMIDDRYYVSYEGIWIQSKELEKYYKPLNEAALANGATVNVDSFTTFNGDLGIGLWIKKDNELVIGFSYVAGMDIDFDFSQVIGLRDSQYISLLVDYAIALGCPLDKGKLTALVTSSINQDGEFTDGSVTVKRTGLDSVWIDW